MIVVSPGAKDIVSNAVNEQNIESAAKNFLKSNAIIPAGCVLELASKKLAMNRIWFVNFRKMIDAQEADIMAVGGVFFSGIAQSDYQFHIALSGVRISKVNSD